MYDAVFEKFRDISLEELDDRHDSLLKKIDLADATMYDIVLANLKGKTEYVEKCDLCLEEIKKELEGINFQVLKKEKRRENLVISWADNEKALSAIKIYEYNCGLNKEDLNQLCDVIIAKLKDRKCKLPRLIKIYQDHNNYSYNESEVLQAQLNAIFKDNGIHVIVRVKNEDFLKRYKVIVIPLFAKGY